MQILQWIVTTGIPWYMITGLVLVVFLIMIEVLNLAFRPGYHAYLEENLPSDGKPTNVFRYLKPIVVWPILFMIMLQAIWNKRAFLEHIIESRKEAKIKVEEIAYNADKEVKEMISRLPEHVQDLMSGVLPYKIEPQWASFTVSKNEGGNLPPDPHICLISALYKGVGETKTQTHAIIPTETGKLILFRTNSAGQDGIEMDATDDFNEAFRLCVNDHGWLKACAPDHESDREAFMANLRDQLGSDDEE